VEHLGDIMKLNGYELPGVDVVIGGSPCLPRPVCGRETGGPRRGAERRVYGTNQNH